MGRFGEIAAGERDLFSAPRPAPVVRPDGIPPEICDLFEQLALQVRARGIEHFSADALLHRIRWEFHVERGDSEYKVNNNYSAPLARWLIKKRPEFSSFFSLRKSQHDQDV